MYREDDIAREARAGALIGEIAELERQKIVRAEQDRRLEAARHELEALQAPTTPPPPRAPGLGAHVIAFGAAAVVTFLGYTLLT
jgi:hypothetical protein